MAVAQPGASALPTSRLGRTDLIVTKVGLGAWAFGGPNWAAGWGDQDDDDSIAAIRRAVELGINWIDTAAVYGLGHSEDVVRRALAPFLVADRPYVFTKCGLVPDERVALRACGSAASIRSEVEGSLRRLGVERIDLYQMHFPPSGGTQLDEYWGTLLALKQEGKVRAVGLSNHGVAQLRAAEKLGHVDTLQPPFSAIRRDAAAAELPWCEAHGTGVIVYSPMQSGLLTGRFTVERAASLPPSDWRSRNAEFSGARLERNLRLAAALHVIAIRRGTSVSAVAIAWTLSWPGVNAAIVGARRAGQLDDWIGAAKLELTSAEMEEVAAAIETVGAGSGPTRPASSVARLDSNSCDLAVETSSSRE